MKRFLFAFWLSLLAMPVYANLTCPTGFTDLGCNRSPDPLYTEADCEACCERLTRGNYTYCGQQCSTADDDDACVQAADNADGICLNVCFVSFPWSTTPTKDNPN